MNRFPAIPTIALALALGANSQEAKPNAAELAASSGVTPCTGTDVSERECEKRDTARLFLLMGKPEAALRILCNTRSAIEVFRPGGALGSDKYEENAAGNVRCLQSVGVEPITQGRKSSLQEDVVPRTNSRSGTAPIPASTPRDAESGYVD
jgi:hypothetical protein